MPTLLIMDGFRFHFYSHEGIEPAHVHVQYGSSTAKFWLGPVVLASAQGMKGKDLSSAIKLVTLIPHFGGVSLYLNSSLNSWYYVFSPCG